jgi:hypothetical protein
MEALSPALVDGMELLIDLMPPDTHVLISDPELVRGRAIELVKTSEEFLHASWAAAAGGGKAPIDLGASSYQPLAEVRAAALARGMAWWTLSPFSAGPVQDSMADGGRGIPIRTEEGEIIDLSERVTGLVWTPEQCQDRSARPIGVIPRRQSMRSPSESVTAGAWSCRPRVGAPRTASWRSSVNMRCLCVARRR